MKPEDINTINSNGKAYGGMNFGLLIPLWGALAVFVASALWSML